MLSNVLRDWKNCEVNSEPQSQVTCSRTLCLANTFRRHQNQIDLDLHVGSRLPAYCTSMGKVLLAFLPDLERDEILDRMTLVPRGPNTLTTKTALLAELRRIRNTGIAVNNEELAYGLRSVAVPVFSANGEAVAALNLAAHRTMASLDDLSARLGPVMQRTAAAISTQLGYRATHRSTTLPTG